jgi:hypothetical protein
MGHSHKFPLSDFLKQRPDALPALHEFAIAFSFVFFRHVSTSQVTTHRQAALGYFAIAINRMQIGVPTSIGVPCGFSAPVS